MHGADRYPLKEGGCGIGYPLDLSELRYCPRCAGFLVARRVSGERLAHPTCSSCGFVLWQSPSPVVAALITRQQAGVIEILLGLRGSEPGWGLWHVPGGFVDAGETLEEALARECEEELGVRVYPHEFLGGFPDRYGKEPILVLAYRCELIGGTPRGCPELNQPTWFSMDQLPPLAFRSCEEALEVLRRRLQGAR